MGSLCIFIFFETCLKKLHADIIYHHWKRKERIYTVVMRLWNHFVRDAQSIWNRFFTIPDDEKSISTTKANEPRFHRGPLTGSDVAGASSCPVLYTKIIRGITRDGCNSNECNSVKLRKLQIPAPGHERGRVSLYSRWDAW